MNANTATCRFDGIVLHGPVTETREMDGLMYAVVTDPGDYLPHVREHHPEMWQEWCERRRQTNSSGRYGMPRKVDGTFLMAGEDVDDVPL